MPESPCYEPILDHGSSKPDSVPVLPVSCGLGPAKRADQAAEICPSWRGDKGGETSSRRLRSRPRIRDFYDTYSSGMYARGRGNGKNWAGDGITCGPASAAQLHVY